jgi:ketosteroid isomerase-like protein
VTGFEELARYQSGDLFVLHEAEDWRWGIGDRDHVEPWRLRVTTTFRRADGEWRVIHRHADPIATVHPHGPLRDT